MEEKQNQCPKTPKIQTPKSFLIRRNSSPICASNQFSFLSKFQYSDHPGAKYLMGTKPTTENFRRFLTNLYQGVYYSVGCLNKCSIQQVKNKKIKLPQRKNSNSKFLLLDLDETLIHTVIGDQKADVSLTTEVGNIKLNVRPYCHHFLSKMSEHFQIYVFTSSCQSYAAPIVNYLNLNKKTIQGIISRDNCLETIHKIFIKDLRIITNRALQNLVIVDNFVPSFAYNIENGIPILSFYDDKQDCELLGLLKILIKIKQSNDVRLWIRENLKLTKILQIEEMKFNNLKTKNDEI